MNKRELDQLSDAELDALSAELEEDYKAARRDDSTQAGRLREDLRRVNALRTERATTGERDAARIADPTLTTTVTVKNEKG